MNWLQTFRGRKGLRGRPKHSLHTCHTAAEPAAEVITNTNNMPTTDSPNHQVKSYTLHENILTLYTAGAFHPTRRCLYTIKWTLFIRTTCRHIVIITDSDWRRLWRLAFTNISRETSKFHRKPSVRWKHVRHPCAAVRLVLTVTSNISF